MKTSMWTKAPDQLDCVFPELEWNQPWPTVSSAPCNEIYPPGYMWTDCNDGFENSMRFHCSTASLVTSASTISVSGQTLPPTVARHVTTTDDDSSAYCAKQYSPATTLDDTSSPLRLCLA